MKDILDCLQDADVSWKGEWLEIIQSDNHTMRKIYASICSVAPTIATVLLLGETGTGKSVMARLIHQHSRRADKPFISVHCGAIPDTLMESELFGHEKGAFTGADRRKSGKFDMARGGTIFLDEIGTLTPSAQIKLLHVLQDGIFSRVGGESFLNADVRIIAATNADLSALVKNGSFRKDLFYRLNVFPVEIPPLKDRLEDLEYLSRIFLRNLNVRYAKEIEALHPSVLDGFRNHDWPGNIRELENVLERAYIIEQGTTMMPQSFPWDIMTDIDPDTGNGRGDTPGLSAARQCAVTAFEHAYLTALLNRTQGRINLAAQIAGVTSRQLNRLLNRHGLDKSQFKPKKEI